MTVAVFDYSKWTTRYPELAASVSAPFAEELFEEAGTYLDNTDSSLVPADPVTFMPRLRFLNMLVAHLAYLSNPNRAGAAGRVSQASQGSVSTTLEMAPATAGSAWYMQSQYGASYWQATASYRTMRLFAGRRC